MTDTILTSLASNGPWAAAAAYLATRILKAWEQDRAQVNELLGGFKSTLESLDTSIEHLVDRLDSRESHSIEAMRIKGPNEPL